MEQLRIIEDEKGNSGEKLKLTDRDYEILEFVLEMKFVGIDEIYTKFFKVKRNGNLSKSDWWARDRVYQLKKEGFLKAVTFYTEAKLFYVATYKAYHILKGRFYGRHFCYPNKDIDVRTFNHDWLVTQCRIDMEEAGRISRWWSEKYIHSESSVFEGISKKYIPDGIFVDHQGKTSAFELEIALKSPKRYRDKVRLYERLMRSGFNSGHRPFERCLFVCLRETVFEHLKKQTLPYGKVFQVQMMSDFKKSLRSAGGKV